jgi:hypothetical protein
MMSCDRFPFKWAMKPTPQASFSRDGCQRPCGSGQPNGDVCDVGIEVIEEIEIRHAESPRKVVNRENRRMDRSWIALESLINQGFSMTAEETGGNLLSAGGAVKTGGVVRCPVNLLPVLAMQARRARGP